MATVYRCDRCKNETTDVDEKFAISIPLEYDRNSASYHDLCKNCLLQLRHWITTNIASKN